MKKTDRDLTKFEKRVLIAKDVKQQLKAYQMIAQRGRYLGVSGDIQFTAYHVPSNLTSKVIQKIFKKEKCFGCAKGAMLVAFVRRFNSMDSPKLLKELNALRQNTATLAGIFGTQLLNQMEVIFEKQETDLEASQRSNR